MALTTKPRRRRLGSVRSNVTLPPDLVARVERVNTALGHQYGVPPGSTQVQRWAMAAGLAVLEARLGLLTDVPPTDTFPAAVGERRATARRSRT